MSLTEREREIRRRLKSDLEHYAARCLKIRTKAGTIVPLVFNKMQRHLHVRLEEQRQRTGKVRAVILKGRQQGCSTYVGARAGQGAHRRVECERIGFQQAGQRLFGRYCGHEGGRPFPHATALPRL
jgi:hypothetical protein